MINEEISVVKVLEPFKIVLLKTDAFFHEKV